jgi:hypothetical protein
MCGVYARRAHRAGKGKGGRTPEMARQQVQQPFEATLSSISGRLVFSLVRRGSLKASKISER